jgi:acetylornithine deacetylase/succinyl-diaminopimelate desuccinylase-like protein
MDPQLVNRVLELAIAIQQIPAPTFNERERGAYIQDRFLQEGLVDIVKDEVGNVYGRLPGKTSTQPIVISAHLDTVFPIETDLHVERLADKITGPGIGDNAVGVAGLFGLLWELNHRQVVLNSDLWLVANVGEEGLGNLRGMRALVDRFGDQPPAYLVLEGMALGQIYHRGLGVSRYRITVTTSGGHSWVDYGRPSAVHVLAHIITRLHDLEIPEQPRTILNVGVIAGGSSVNTIAAEAHLDLDLRSEDQSTLCDLVSKVDSVIQNFQSPDVTITSEMTGQRPIGEISQDHPLVEIAVKGLEIVGIQPRLNIGSTDANIPLSLGYPAICIGLTTGNGAHTVNEFIHTPPLLMGVHHLLWIVEALDRD